MLKLDGHQNSKKQGDVGLGSAIAYFTACGYTVCLPLTDSQEYDLVVDNDSLKEVQVKTVVSKENGVFKVGLRTITGSVNHPISKSFDNTKVDLLFILTADNDIYLIPSLDIKATAAINLGDKYNKYKINTSVRIG